MQRLVGLVLVVLLHLSLATASQYYEVVGDPSLTYELVCPANEELQDTMPCCEPTCDNDCSTVKCSKMYVSQPTCVCKQGYVRHKGRCIPLSQCPPKPPCPPACDDNEELLPSPPSCEPTCTDDCAGRVAHSRYVDQPTCVCKKGYRRHKGKCVRVDQCPSCGPYATLKAQAPCCEPTCDNDCSNVLCINAYQNEEPVCVCQDGYVKHNSTCIKRELCPTTGYVAPKQYCRCGGKRKPKGRVPVKYVEQVVVANAPAPCSCYQQTNDGRPLDFYPPATYAPPGSYQVVTYAPPVYVPPTTTCAPPPPSYAPPSYVPPPSYTPQKYVPVPYVASPSYAPLPAYTPPPPTMPPPTYSPLKYAPPAYVPPVVTCAPPPAYTPPPPPTMPLPQQYVSQPVYTPPKYVPPPPPAAYSYTPPPPVDYAPQMYVSPSPPAPYVPPVYTPPPYNSVTMKPPCPYAPPTPKPYYQQSPPSSSYQDQPYYAIPALKQCSCSINAAGGMPTPGTGSCPCNTGGRNLGEPVRSQTYNSPPISYNVATPTPAVTTTTLTPPTTTTMATTTPAPCPPVVMYNPVQSGPYNPMPYQYGPPSAPSSYQQDQPYLKQLAPTGAPKPVDVSYIALPGSGCLCGAGTTTTAVPPMLPACGAGMSVFGPTL
uniref:EGF-like domain-containing protein n=1 Tax=Anopheles dirus TaxID=7168 RepID=A0A182NXS7_9DIPT